MKLKVTQSLRFRKNCNNDDFLNINKAVGDHKTRDRSIQLIFI